MRIYYPQLSHYPLRKRTIVRTVVNTLADGTDIRIEDFGAAKMSWDLNYASLTLDELTALQTFHAASEGRLNSFTFLDPAGNLLAWSEDLSHTVWEPDPLIQIVAGIADPMSGQGAFQITNTAQASQKLLQPLDGPSWYQYCFSAYVRSAAPSTIALVRGQSRQSAAVNAVWTRVSMSGSETAQADGIQFGIELPPGAQIEIFGPQVEAQLAASGYRKTNDRGGVYPASRFDHDALSVTATSINQYSCAIRIVSAI